MDSEFIVSVAADEYINAAQAEGIMAMAIYSVDGTVIRFKGPPLTRAQIAETLRNMAELFERSVGSDHSTYVGEPGGVQ